MPSPADRSPVRLVGYAFVAALVALAAILGYLQLAPGWRPLALRLTCAAGVIVAASRLVGRVRRSTEGDPVSPLDAPPRAVPGVHLDERFVRLRDDLAFSTMSTRYFEAQLWPRLRTLGGADLPRPGPEPRRRRRGPSLATLERLIAEIERRTGA